MQRICWCKVQGPLKRSRVSLSKGPVAWVWNRPRNWPYMPPKWSRSWKTTRKSWTCSATRLCQSAARSGEGLWKEEAMQDPCQKGPWSLAKRFHTGCIGCWYPKGLHFLAKREYIPDPCQKVLVVFAGSFGQNGLNQQSLDQRDCSDRCKVEKRNCGWGYGKVVLQGCSTKFFVFGFTVSGVPFCQRLR